MTEVPLISITQDDSVTTDVEDDSSRRPSINDCHTDVEDIDSDPSRRNSLVSGLKKSAQCNGSVTDVEDYEDSDDNDASEPEVNYGPEFSLNEFLDQGTIDESSDLNRGNAKKKLVRMQSIAKSASPTAFTLGVTADLGGITDCEDMQDSGDDDDESEKVFSEDEQPIILEGCNAVDIHDAVNQRRKVEKYAPKAVEPSSSITSSDSEAEEKPKMRLKAHKHHKRGQRIEDAKSDIESMLFSDEERRRSSCKEPLVLETPDIEVMAFDGSEVEEAVEESTFPEINITFAGEPNKPKKKKSKYRITPAPSPMLALPDNQDEGHTDVENLNSSDDEDEQPMKPKPKHCIPIAVIKCDALTDVEDFGDDSGDDSEWEEKPDIQLPSPCREFTILVENKSGEPTKSTTPLPANMLLGFHDLEADKGLTDVEDFSDESGEDGEDAAADYDVEYVPELDGGVVESSDHTTVKGTSLSVGGATPEPITDTEDMFVKQNKNSECRRRRTKSKHSQQQRPKGLFLDTKLYCDDDAGGAHTDVEDLNVEDDDVLLKDKNVKQRRATVPGCSSQNADVEGKTDIEEMSGDDIVDLLRSTPELQSPIELDSCYMTRSRDVCGSKRNSVHFLELNLPEIHTTSPTPEPAQNSTDVEDVVCISEGEDLAVSYSRAQTATPQEVNCNLDDLCVSRVHEINSGAFDKVKEHREMKENLCLVESHTDIENFDDDGQAN